MAHNAKYHEWLFRRPTSHLLQERMQFDIPVDGTVLHIHESRRELTRSLENRRQLEMLAEARELKANLTDLW